MEDVRDWLELMSKANKLRVFSDDIKRCDLNEVQVIGADKLAKMVGADLYIRERDCKEFPYEICFEYDETWFFSILSDSEYEKFKEESA